MVWTSLSLSIFNFFALPNKSVQSTKDQNSSFHRINSEMNSDVSDESDAESEMNTSLRSNLSSFSKQSIWHGTKSPLNSTIASKAPSLHSLNSLRRRPYGASTQSIASTQQLADMNATFSSEHGFYRDSQMDLTRDRLNSSHKPFMSSQSSDIFSQKLCPSAMSLSSLNKTFTNAENSFRSASRNSFYDIPNDFESGITQLSISGVGGKHFNNRRQTDSVFGSSDPFRESLRQRKSLLSPSRLSLNESHHSVNQSSWLAGGYWNSTSPQKKNPHHPNELRSDQRIHQKEVFPIISRTSSKSSGFESRENSLCDDTETDRTFSTYEPRLLTQSTTIPDGLIKPQPQKPNNTFSMMNGNSCQSPSAPYVTAPNSDLFANPFGVNQRTSPNSSLLSRSFSQVSLRKPTPTPSMRGQNHNSTLNFGQMASTQNQMTGINTDLPIRTFQRGSLIKLHDSHTIDH